MFPISPMLKRHGAAIVLALLSGLILGWPHLLPAADHPYLQADEWRYAAFVHAIEAGDWDFSEIYVKEHRDDSWPVPRASLWICGALARAVGGAGNLYRLTDFVLPPLIWIGLYACGIRLGLPRSVSLLVVSIYVLHHADLFAVLGALERHPAGTALRWYAFPFLFDSIFDSYDYQLTRFPEPLLYRVAEVALLMLLFPALAGRRWAIAGAGLLLGAVIYLAFYDWTVMLPALLAAAALLAWQRRPEARRLAVVMGVGVVVSLPYTLPAVGFARDPGHRIMLAHAALQETHRLFPHGLGRNVPAGPLCLLALAVAAAAAGVRTPGRTVFAALTAGLVPGCFFQVITGWTIQPDHWYHMHVMPVFTAALGLGFGLLAFRFLRPRVAAVAVSVALALSLVHGAGLFALTRVHPCGYLEELRAALARVEPGAVVLHLVPEEQKVAGPHTWSFLPHAPLSPVPTEELTDRFVTAMKLLGAGREPVEALFDPDKPSQAFFLVAGFEFVRLKDRPDGTPNRLPAEQRARWLERYDALPEDPGALLAEIRRRYAVDYVLISPAVEAFFDPAVAAAWTPVMVGPKVRLYKLP